MFAGQIYTKYDNSRSCALGGNSTWCARECGSEAIERQVDVHMGRTFCPMCTKRISGVEKIVEKFGKIWKKVEKSYYFCNTLKTELK